MQERIHHSLGSIIGMVPDGPQNLGQPVFVWVEMDQVESLQLYGFLVPERIIQKKQIGQYFLQGAQIGEDGE